MRTGYEVVENLKPCPACGSRKWWFDGQEWRCWTCVPCPEKHPITAEPALGAALSRYGRSYWAASVGFLPGVRPASIGIVIPRQACAVVFIALLPAIAVSAEKVRNWQTGKVIDTERSRYFAGTVSSGNTIGTAQTNGSYGTYQGQTNTTQTAVYRVYQTFAIEGETYAYIAQERLRWKWSKPANLTVNAPVKFAVEKRKLFVIDDDGKEHEMEIVKQVLKQPAPEALNP